MFVLQHFDDMFETNNFEERMSIEPCTKKIETNFFNYSNMTSNNIKCLSLHGHMSQLTDILKKSNSR